MAEQAERPRPARPSVIAIVVAVLAGAGVAVAGSQGGAVVGSIPVFALCVGLAFAIQWVAFSPRTCSRPSGSTT